MKHKFNMDPRRTRRNAKQGGWLIVAMGLGLGLSTMGWAQTSFQALAPCSRLSPLPVTLGAQLAQHVDRMACAEQRLRQGPEAKRQTQIEARQQAIAGIKTSLSHLNRALLRGMLALPETLPLQAFKDAFKVAQGIGDRIESKTHAGSVHGTRATARAQLDSAWSTAFEQLDMTVQQLLSTIELLEPPAHIVPVALSFPSPGVRWQTRVTTSAGASTSRNWIALEPGRYREKPVHRMSNGKAIRMFDVESGSWVGVVIPPHQTLVSATPHNGVRLSPLWVGKSWMMVYTYKDARHGGKRFANQVRRMAVTAYEPVTVPAGTYQAFKVEGRSYATRLTVWYAPSIHLEVKRVAERLQTHYKGPGTSTTTLIAYSP